MPSKNSHERAKQLGLNSKNTIQIQGYRYGSPKYHLPVADCGAFMQAIGVLKPTAAGWAPWEASSEEISRKNAYEGVTWDQYPRKSVEGGGVGKRKELDCDAGFGEAAGVAPRSSPFRAGPAGWKDGAFGAPCSAATGMGHDRGHSRCLRSTQCTGGLTAEGACQQHGWHRGEEALGFKRGIWALHLNVHHARRGSKHPHSPGNTELEANMPRFQSNLSPSFTAVPGKSLHFSESLRRLFYTFTDAH